jgi:hypothetical protein
MIKCDNCANPAEYEYNPLGAQAVYFCGFCIPGFLIDPVKRDEVPKVPHSTQTISEPEAVAEEPKATSRKKKDTVADNVAEEVPSDIKNPEDSDEAGAPNA